MMWLITAMVASAGIASTVVIDGPMNGRVIRAAKGSTVVVRLETQPGTGYSWRVRALAKNLVSIGAGKLEHNGGGTGVTGGTDVQVFRFRVKSRGKGELRLAYARPWEKDKPAAKTFSVIVDSR